MIFHGTDGTFLAHFYSSIAALDLILSPLYLKCSPQPYRHIYKPEQTMLFHSPTSFIAAMNWMGLFVPLYGNQDRAFFLSLFVVSPAAKTAASHRYPCVDLYT